MPRYQKRKKLSKKKSKRDFSKNSIPKKKNISGRPMRGGIRL